MSAPPLTHTSLYNLLLLLCYDALLLQLYGQDLRPVAPPYNYAAVSVSNVVATFCQYEALKHVSFPMQVRVCAVRDVACVRTLASCLCLAAACVP